MLCSLFDIFHNKRPPINTAKFSQPVGDRITGFVPFFRNKFPGLFQDSDWFFKGSKIHIYPYTPKISMLILLTAFHALYIF